MFNGKLEFDISLIPYKGDDSWIAETINEIHACLIGSRIPDAKDGCDFCAYRTAVGDVLKPDQTIFDLLSGKDFFS